MKLNPTSPASKQEEETALAVVEAYAHELQKQTGRRVAVMAYAAVEANYASEPHLSCIVGENLGVTGKTFAEIVEAIGKHKDAKVERIAALRAEAAKLESELTVNA